MQAEGNVLSRKVQSALGRGWGYLPSQAVGAGLSNRDPLTLASETERLHEPTSSPLNQNLGG